MFKKGDHVSWNWGAGKGHGTVKSVLPRKTTRKIGGEAITRNGTSEDPALYIDSEHGHNVLKLASEVHKAG